TLSITWRTRSGRRAAFAASDMPANATAERSVPALTSDTWVRTRTCPARAAGLGTSSTRGTLWPSRITDFMAVRSPGWAQSFAPRFRKEPSRPPWRRRGAGDRSAALEQRRVELHAHAALEQLDVHDEGGATAAAIAHETFQPGERTVGD